MKTKTKQPLTPQQAINNFKLFLELSPHSSFHDYYRAVQELARTCLELGIEGDDRERDDMLAFIREQVELWDNAGDRGFPLYEHGKRILARYPPTPPQ